MRRIIAIITIFAFLIATTSCASTYKSKSKMKFKKSDDTEAFVVEGKGADLFFVTVVGAALGAIALWALGYYTTGRDTNWGWFGFGTGLIGGGVLSYMARDNEWFKIEPQDLEEANKSDYQKYLERIEKKNKEKE